MPVTRSSGSTRLAELTASGEDGAAVVGTAQQELTELLSLDGCLFEALPYDTELPVLERSGALTQQSHRHQGNGFALPAGGVSLPVLARGRPVGRFVLTPQPGVGVTLERRIVAVALADQVGGAVGGASMNVIVVGCGRVGSELATSIAACGHEVTVVDKLRRALRRLPRDWSGPTVQGLGFDRETLERAGIAEADALAAVTSGDNSNILTARIASETYEVPRVVARIYDPRRAVIYERMGIAAVATVTWTTDQMTAPAHP